MYFVCLDLLTNQLSCIIRFDDKMGIPFDEANSDYQQYLAWVAEGNTAEEYKPGETNEQTQPVE